MVLGFKERPRHFFSDPRPAATPPGSRRFGAPRPERPRDPANPAELLSASAWVAMRTSWSLVFTHTHTHTHTPHLPVDCRPAPRHLLPPPPPPRQLSAAPANAHIPRDMRLTRMAGPHLFSRTMAAAKLPGSPQQDRRLRSWRAAPRSPSPCRPLHPTARVTTAAAPGPQPSDALHPQRPASGTPPAPRTRRRCLIGGPGSRAVGPVRLRARPLARRCQAGLGRLAICAARTPLIPPLHKPSAAYTGVQPQLPRGMGSGGDSREPAGPGLGRGRRGAAVRRRMWGGGIAAAMKRRQPVLMATHALATQSSASTSASPFSRAVAPPLQMQRPAGSRRHMRHRLPGCAAAAG